MRFFLDGARPEEARKAREWGMLDGAVLSPRSAEEAGLDYRAAVRDIAALSDGPVLVEVHSSDAKGMYKEGRELHKLGKDIVINLPLNPEAMKVVRLLSQDQIVVAVSLCFTATQALLAAKAGAAYVAPYVGRLDEIGAIGMDIVEQILRVYDNYGFQTLVMVDSLRNPVHVLDAALMGADVAAIPFSILEQLFKHPLTDAGLARLSHAAEPARGKHP